MRKVEATGRIRITKVPDGEAPLEVRKAWVGLELPCGPICGYAAESGKSVLSHEPTPNRYEVDVPQREALEILAAKDPQATAWWYAHGFPQGDDWFNFAREEVEIISGVTMQKVTVYDNMETGHWRPMFTYTPR
jgi:hypothetical protein